jgi:hypothetical protein
VLAALGRVASQRANHRRDTNSELEDVLRQSRPSPCDLLDAVGTRFLLFLVSQRWESAWIDAISRSLEVCRPNPLYDVCGEHPFDIVWKRQVENLHPSLGRILRICCVHDFRVGDGLGWQVPKITAFRFQPVLELWIGL